MKKRAIYTLPFKLTAFLLVVVTLVLAVGCVFGAVLLTAGEAYTKSEADFRDDILWNMAYSERYAISSIAHREDWKLLQDVYGESNMLWAVYNEAGDLLAANCDEQTQRSLRFEDWNYFYDDVYHDEVTYQELESVYCVRGDFREGFPSRDRHAFNAYWLELGYSLRYAVYYVGIGAILFAVVLFVLLMAGAGRKNETEELSPGPMHKVPLDLLTAIVVGLEAVVVILIGESLNVHGYVSDLSEIAMLVILYVLIALAMASVLLGWCMSLAVRLKKGGWWKNTLVYYAVMLCWKIVKLCAVWLWKIVKWFFVGLRKVLGKFFGWIGSLLRGIPLVWKTAVVVATVSGMNLIFIAATIHSDALVPLWFFETILVGGGVLYIALLLRKLQCGGRALADGDLSYQVDTKGMFWNFKQHGENLNSIALGMNRAVEERMKSERLKTELITNVSHDIKTPLTSIINYVDLLSKEQTDNEKIAEYCEVLTRQSERLKKLIGDLVDASKASTGNMEVNLAPCEVGVLLTQTVGEYEKRIQACDLNLIVRQPDTPVRIMADGRLLWRVFDNLMNNIVKYAQPMTRVYLSLEENEGHAIVTFKNTSKYALDISGEELVERFVRGDSSRSTEGSGLGLSIAQSLTELQNGTLKLTVDGDLFKAILEFPKIL